MEVADIKDDNSFSKNVNEEEKGETIINIKLDKNKDKADDIDINNINNTEMNNIDSNNSEQVSHKKSDNKIKLNQEVLKQTKKSTDKVLIEKYNGNKANTNEDVNEPIPAFGGIGANIFTKINRCFSDIAIMVITILMLLFSLTVLTFSILDFIKKIRNSNTIFFMNNVLFLTFDVINISSILIYHIINRYLKPKFSHNIILLLIVPLVICSIVRCLQYLKKNDNMFSIIINLCQNIFACLINSLTLFYFFIDSKKRKSAMHGIEEIINFTELNANVKTKKDEGLQLDIINYNKDKPTNLVEEEKNSNTNTSNN